MWHGYRGRLLKPLGDGLRPQSDRSFLCEPRHCTDLPSRSSRCPLSTLVWIGEPRAWWSKQHVRPTSISLLLGSARGELLLDVYSVLDLHVRLHVHEVLTRLAHHLRLSLGLGMRVRGMCHHGHLARMTGLWCVAWVSV